MIDFLKRFGLGILYVLVSPFALAFLVGWSLYCLVIFFIEMFKGIKSFFNGKKFFEPLPEDIEAQRILTLEPYNNGQVDNIAINVPTMNQNQNNNNGGNSL